jgi:hypothetical protein
MNAQATNGTLLARMGDSGTLDTLRAALYGGRAQLD